MKQPLCDWMAAANGFAIYSAHMIPWPRSGMVSLPIKRRLPRKRRAVGHNPRIITALRLLYHVREAAWYNRPSWRERAAPAYRPGHKIGIITALRLLYHSNKPIRACLPPSGSETGKAGFGCGVTCAVRCFAAAAAGWRTQTALPFVLRILYHISTQCVHTLFSQFCPSHKDRRAPHKIQRSCSGYQANGSLNRQFIQTEQKGNAHENH